MIVKSVLKSLGPRNRFRPWANETIGPSQGPDAPGRLPTLNPVAQPACINCAFGFAVVPSPNVCVGWQGCNAIGIAAPRPHAGPETIGPDGTAYSIPK